MIAWLELPLNPVLSSLSKAEGASCPSFVALVFVFHFAVGRFSWTVLSKVYRFGWLLIDELSLSPPPSSLQSNLPSPPSPAL
jgi:hypothetical protein